MIGRRTIQYLFRKPIKFNQRNAIRSSYYTNVLIWTLIFAFPFTLIIDILFNPQHWLILTVTRVGIIFISLKLQTVQTTRTVSAFISEHFVFGIFLYTSALFFLYAPDDHKLMYFLLLCCTSALIHTISFISILHSAICITFPLFMIIYTDVPGGYKTDTYFNLTYSLAFLLISLTP